MTQRAFGRDDLVTVLLIREFKKGDALILSGTPTANTPTAQNDICLVKLVVGPGNAGPAGAPSTSPGIGIEAWLPTPENWNKRVHNLGGGGWQGGSHTSTTAIANTATAAVAGRGRARSPPKPIPGTRSAMVPSP
jgi:feruloyl esterase